MTEEEKKARDILVNEIADILIGEYCKQCKICDNENIECYYSKAIDTIDNLIKKQQKEIEEWQKAYIRENNYWLKFRNKINKIANNNKDCSDNEVIKAVKELEEKNASLQKEIKLMKSININDNYISKDKINDKIKEYQNKLFQDVEENKVVEYENIIQVLEELLEENNKCK